MSAAQTSSADTAGPGAGTSVSQYLIALPHIAFGGGWRTQIVIGNASSAAAVVTLYYFGDTGNPLSVAIGGASSYSTAVTIPSNGQQIVEPDWQGSTTSAGWVAVVNPNAGVKIQGIFLWHNPAGAAGNYTAAVAPIVSQATPACILPMPASSALTMPYDETGGQFSGYGFANTTAAPVTFSLTFYNQNGGIAGQYSEQLAAFGHDAILLKDKLPRLVGQEGTMVIGGQGIVALGFRFNADYTFTTWLP